MVEEAGPHGKRVRAEVAAFIGLLLLTFLAVGVWVDARTQEDETVAGMTGRMERPADQTIPPAQNNDVPAARPHPRGLPRKTARPRVQRRGNRPLSGLPDASEQAGRGDQRRGEST